MPKIVYRGIKESDTGKVFSALLPPHCSGLYLTCPPEEYQPVMVEGVEPKDGETDCRQHH
ncbi:hypothetical protein ES703_40346 [subsurface metagenome]